jgi:hypothetical protein
MPSPDLTRFDFNAKNWLNSEHVEVMTDAEIGQYIMLLAKSWLMGKDVTLPDEPVLLAKWAHCSKVSNRVLDRFPLVETESGSRRRNDTLFQEWKAATARSFVASDSGKKGNEIRWASPSNRPAMATQSRQESPKPNQAVPNQSNQTIQSEKHGQGNFKNITSRFRAAFQVTPSRNEKASTAYHQKCEQYGEDYLLEKFEEWSLENQWVREKKAKFALTAFYRDLDIVAEGDELRDKKAQDSQKQLENELNSAARDAEFARKLAIEERDKDLQRIAEEEARAENFTI